MFSIYCTNGSSICLQSLWSELWGDGLGIKTNKKKFLVVHKNSDDRKKIKNWKYQINIFVWRLIWPWRSCRALSCNVDLSITTTINAAIYRSGPHGSKAKRKACRRRDTWKWAWIMKNKHGGLRAWGRIFCGVMKLFSSDTKHFVWQNQHHAFCEVWWLPHAARKRLNRAEKRQIPEDSLLQSAWDLSLQQMCVFQRDDDSSMKPKQQQSGVRMRKPVLDQPEQNHDLTLIQNMWMTSRPSAWCLRLVVKDNNDKNLWTRVLICLYSVSKPFSKNMQFLVSGAHFHHTEDIFNSFPL